MLDGPTLQLLAIVVLPIIVGFIWMFAVTIFRFTSGSHNRVPEQIRNAAFRLFSIADAFDPERAILWEAQIPVLRRIGSGISISRFFENCNVPLCRYPELFEGTTLAAWLEFLRQSALVEIIGSEVRLTVEGRAFLAVLNGRYSETGHWTIHQKRAR